MDDKRPGHEVWTQDLVRSISSERFDTYRRLAGNDAAALHLYGMNVALSAAFYGPLQALEVTLRNAIDGELSRRHPGWLSGTAVLHGPELRQIQDARDRLDVQGKSHDRGRLIAELSLGFWTGLFANAYDTDLWRTSTYRIFYPRQHRAPLHDALDRLRTLRNRIAHHEPIVQRRLLDDHQRLLDVLNWLNPSVAQWVDERSRVIGLLMLEPAAVADF